MIAKSLTFFYPSNLNQTMARHIMVSKAKQTMASR